MKLMVVVMVMVVEEEVVVEMAVSAETSITINGKPNFRKKG
jgi:hypothetical protein